MNKLFLFISVFFVASMFFACDKTKTAQELLKEEKKAIDRFISQSGFSTSDKDTAIMYEKDGYFKTKEGLYIHVIDSGNGDKAKYNREILVRFKDAMYFKNDTTTFSNMASANPQIFYYGNTYSYSGLACDGWALALSYVRENAEVSLIVPSGLQAYSDQSSYSPLYYGYLKYRFK